MTEDLRPTIEGKASEKRWAGLETLTERIYETVASGDSEQAQTLIADIAYWGGSDMRKISRGKGILAIALAEVKPRDETVKVVFRTGLKIFRAFEDAKRRDQGEEAIGESYRKCADQIHRYLRSNPNGGDFDQLATAVTNEFPDEFDDRHVANGLQLLADDGLVYKARGGGYRTHSRRTQPDRR